MSHSAFARIRTAPSQTNCRSGMTLLEMVVSLAILAALSTIAVRSIAPLADQARYEATQNVLNELREVTVGATYLRQPNGQAIVSGYIADTGSLPTALVDLFTQPVGLSAFASQTFDSDRDGTDDISLSSGWNGPYMQLGAGVDSVVDGWGNPVLIDPDAGVFDFTSYGSDADSAVPETGYRADLVVEIPTSNYQGDVALRLFEIDGTTQTRVDPSTTGTEQLGVLYYCVNAAGGTTGAIQEILLPVDAAGSFETTLSNQIHGLSAARGIKWLDADGDDVLDVGETITLKSFVHYFTVTSLSNSRIEMELR